MKKLYFIPGFREDISSAEYKKFFSVLKSNKIDVIPVHITWKYRSLSDWVKEFEEFYFSVHKKGDIDIFAGFSLGAVISLIAASNLSPASLVLCSTSLIFSEDVAEYKEIIEEVLGKKRFADFSTYSYRDYGKNIKSKTYILVGEEEGKEMLHTSKGIARVVKKSKLLVVPGVSHDILDTRYNEALNNTMRRV